MGEIFKMERPKTPLEFTGERFTTAIGGQIELEHMHRYLMARSLCRGKDVLDIACGEGYGAAILAQVACRVVGVDADSAAVLHAARSYKKPNLRFACGDARRIPLPDATVDVVTSFETLEHFLEHANFFREIHRVLRPEGFLLISTPDSEIYSPSGRGANPFHVRELSHDEFVSELSAHFPSVSVFRQRPLVGSLIAQANREPAVGRLVTYDKRDEAYFEENTGLTRAIFLIAIASKASTNNAGLFSSVLIDTDRVDLQADKVAAAHCQIARLREDNAAAHHELTQLQEANAAARQKIIELEQLRNRLNEELNAILASCSWRLTAPIRRVLGRYPAFTRPIKRSMAAIVHSPKMIRN
jgi:ubiquinone/menaquinone biosynthesis C-methylase UbiE